MFNDILFIQSASQVQISAGMRLDRVAIQGLIICGGLFACFIVCMFANFDRGCAVFSFFLGLSMIIVLVMLIFGTVYNAKQRTIFFENISPYELTVSDVQRYGIESKPAWQGTTNISGEAKTVIFPQDPGIEPAVGQPCTIVVFSDDSGTYLMPEQYQLNAS